MGVLRKLIDALAMVLAIIVAPFVIVAAYIFGDKEKAKLDWTPKMFADCLRTRCSDNPDWMEWDLFTCCEMADPRLEALRQRAMDIEDKGCSQVAPVYLDENTISELEQLASDAEQLPWPETAAGAGGYGE